MGAYTGILLMCYSRIRANMETGRKLQMIKKLVMGGRIETLLQSDMPMVILSVNRIEESYRNASKRNTLTATIEVGIKLIFPTLNRRDANRLFQTGFRFDASLLNAGVFRDENFQDTGIIFLMELVADSVNTGYLPDDTEIIDPRLSDQSAKALVINWGPIESMGDSFLTVDGTITAETPDFVINGRSTT